MLPFLSEKEYACKRFMLRISLLKYCLKCSYDSKNLLCSCTTPVLEEYTRLCFTCAKIFQNRTVRFINFATLIWKYKFAQHHFCHFKSRSVFRFRFFSGQNMNAQIFRMWIENLSFLCSEKILKNIFHARNKHTHTPRNLMHNNIHGRRKWLGM